MQQLYALLTTAYTISYLTYPVLVLAGEFTVSNTQGHLSTRDKTPQCVCISTPMKPYFMAKTEITAYRGWHNSLPTVPNLVSGFYCLYCYNFGHSPHKPQQKDYVQRHPHKSLGRWLINPKFSPTKHFLFVCKTVDVQMMEKKTLCQTTGHLGGSIWCLIEFS